MTSAVDDRDHRPVRRAVKARQQAMWASGDFAVIGTTLQIVGELLCEGVDLRAGERVLDVAAGNGNATLAAARRFARVTSTDYVPALLERGRRRAEAEGLDVTFEVADAEALPYADASFDVVLSTFGVMFAPDHEQAAARVMRVCRPGGRIGLASWTPQGSSDSCFTGDRPLRAADARRSLAAVVGHRRAYAGSVRRRRVDRAHGAALCVPLSVAGALGRRVPDLLWPVHKAFAALDAERQAALEHDLIALLERCRSGRRGRPGGAGRVPGDRDHEMSGAGIATRASRQRRGAQ